MADDVFGVEGTTQAKHFHVEKAVAEGGFAVVYRAHHDMFRAPVALKCLKVPATLTDSQKESFLEKFREEAELLFRLSATIQAVVRPLQVGTLDLPNRFVPFLALEWLEGETLEQIRNDRSERKEAPLGLHKLVRMLGPIAVALDQAHRLSGPSGPIVVVHCDIKPDNLFVTRAGGAESVKILDFGIARVKSATTRMAGKATDASALAAFTPQYGSPEQWNPEAYGQTGPWTDVYGLAISLVDLILGRPPIDGSLVAMMQAALDSKRRPTPRAMGVTVSDAVERCFLRALAVEPASRTPSIAEFWRELEAGLQVRSSFAAIDVRRDDSEPPPPMEIEQARAQDAARRVPPNAANVAADASSSLELDLPALELPPLGAPARSATPAAVPTAAPSVSAPAASAPPPAASAHPQRNIGVKVVDPVDQALDDQRLALQLAVSPNAPASRRRPPSAPPALSTLARTHAPPKPVLSKLGTPIFIAVVAMGIMIADQVYLRATGSQLAIGPARPYWIAAPLVGIAAILAFVRLMSD